ncbi:nocturnin isoform X2 [Chrysoperla carnea]|uniref:nocturnin isoform X2 n=1 Tax=Chrysoperla carnea TaxID=189513 RepID=UPI001D065BDA|nr:nocturnin isoform X2 [Chrysoperla carnea]
MTVFTQNAARVLILKIPKCFASRWTTSTKLKLPRMGSFTSATKILNDDCQDNDVQLPERLSRLELLEHCSKALFHLPSLVKRSLKYRDFTNYDLNKGILQLSSISEICSDFISGPQNVRVLQWNILSQSLGVMHDNFVFCPDEALEWKTRRYRIIEEIISYCPDVICLQEVDHFNFLKTVLGTQGYKGMFFPKPDSPCLYINGNNGPDGCAIFYREDKFDLVRMESRILEVWRVQSNQVALVAILRIRETGQEICVSTTHLKAKTGALLSTLRNEQGKDLLEFVKVQAENRPLILCGDFNAEPSEPIYMTVLKHNDLKLASAYANLKSGFENEITTSGEREPPYTTWKVRAEGEACHTLDYIFYSRDKFMVNSVLEFPSGDEIGEGRVPSLSYPSDHFSLLCDFRINDNSTSENI